MRINDGRYPRSQELKTRAEKIIPTGTQTFSKAPTSFVDGATPLYLERGDGSKVHDVDGNEYIDYILGLGPVTLGYGHSAVTSAVEERLGDGTLLSLPHSVEIELSERLSNLVPAAEMVRFGKNGSDVTSAAVRLARAYTGKEKIVHCGYHGWQDWYVANTSRNRGVPDAIKPLTLDFEYNNIESLKRVLEENTGEVAAVIMEPVGTERPGDDFLQAVRDVTEDHDVLLVFDEVITGFRLDIGGAQAYYDVTPDLACFGKGMANGFPISALVGREEVMRELKDVFFSFTFGGEILSIVAALATIDVYERENVVDHMWNIGGELASGVQQLITSHGLNKALSCEGLPPWTAVNFEGEGDDDLARKSLFQQEVINRGVMFNGNQFISASHTQRDIKRTLDVYDEAMSELSTAINDDSVRDRLEGEMIRPVFRRENARTSEEM